MFTKFTQRPVLIIGSIVFFLMMAVVVQLFFNQNSARKQLYKVEKKELTLLFDRLDTSFWRNKTNSMRLVEQAESISKKISDSNSLALAIYYKIKISQTFEQNDRVLILTDQALTIAQKHQDEILIAKIKNVIGNYYYYKDNYYLAMRYYTEAIQIAESRKEKVLAETFANGLGLVNLALGNYDKAISYFEQTVHADAKQGYLRGVSGALMNIGSCYLEKKDYAKAVYYNTKAMNLANQIHDSEAVCKLYISLALINLANKQNGENEAMTLDYFYKALDYSKRIKNDRMYGIALQDIGTYFANHDLLIKAEEDLNRSLVIFSKMGFRIAEKKAILTLSEIKKKQGKWKEAYQFFSHSVELNDSIQNLEVQKKISDYQFEIEFQKKQYEKELLQKKYDAQKIKIIILIISTISTIIIAWGVYKNLKKSIKLQKLRNSNLQEKFKMAEKIKELEKSRYQVELEAKNKELISFSLRLTTKNDLLNAISKISDQYYQEHDLNKRYYHDLTEIIEDNLDADKEWAQFKELFEKVHDRFFNNLKRDFPDLTEHELRFCAYIKINLRPKEICRILNISINTVKSFRYRLKKKLGLGITGKIEDFLRNY